jgi:hypothetical protein
MSYIRADGYRLKDPEDDAAYQVLMGDVQRLALNFARGSRNSAYQLTPTAEANLNSSSGTPADSTSSSAFTGFTATLASTVSITTNTLINTWTSSGMGFSTVGSSLTSSAFTATTAGYYQLGCCLNVTVSNSPSYSDAYAVVDMQKNGVSQITLLSEIAHDVASNTINYFSSNHTLACVLPLNVGDAISFRGSFGGDHLGDVVKGLWSMHLLQAS